MPLYRKETKAMKRTPTAAIPSWVNRRHEQLHREWIELELPVQAQKSKPSAKTFDYKELVETVFLFAILTCVVLVGAFV